MAQWRQAKLLDWTINPYVLLWAPMKYGNIHLNKMLMYQSFLSNLFFFFLFLRIGLGQNQGWFLISTSPGFKLGGQAKPKKTAWKLVR